MSDHNMHAAGLPVLLQASWPSLSSLYLASNNLDPLAVNALSKSSYCEKLEDLELSGNALGEAGVRALRLGRWDNSTMCNLERCSVATKWSVV